MENMDKGLIVPKWVLINRPKIPQMPPKCLTQFVCPSPKVWDFRKRLSLGVGSLWGEAKRGPNVPIPSGGPTKQATTYTRKELSKFDRQFPEFSGTQNNFLSTFLLCTFDRMI